MDYIVASSGFIIPKNHYYQQFDPKESPADAFFNRNTIMTNNTKIIEFYKDHNVYRSEVISKALNDYINYNSFDNYIRLIDITTDVFKDITFMEFFKTQATNSYLSNLSYKFCLDVLGGKFTNNHKDYSIAPFNIRFITDKCLTSVDVNRRITEFEKASVFNNSWSNFLTELAENKQAFVTFFKYLFADCY